MMKKNARLHITSKIKTGRKNILRQSPISLSFQAPRKITILKKKKNDDATLLIYNELIYNNNLYLSILHEKPEYRKILLFQTHLIVKQ